MTTYHNVSAIALTHTEKKDNLLLVHRSSSCNFWPKKWYIISEHINEGETPLQAAYRGLKEELCLENVLSIERKAQIKEQDPYNGYHDHIFDITLYTALTDVTNFTLNHENSEYVWKDVKDIDYSNSIFFLKKHLILTDLYDGNRKY